MKSTLAELYHELKTSPELAKLLSSVAKELHNRNVFPMHALAMYKGEDIKELARQVRMAMEATDMSSRDSINGDEYQSFRHALWFGDEDDGHNIDRSMVMVLAYLLQEHWPGIDEYVQHLDDTKLAKQLGLAIDGEGMVELTGKMELRRHALVLPEQNTMIYPHQFLRRFYSANFVNMPAMLEHCRKQGLEVKLRLDPLRITQPRYYQDIFEADYWYGPKFDSSLLLSKDKEPVRTLHYTNSEDKIQNITYPLSYTLFRSDMIDDHERQFMVEEYVPVTNPELSGHRVPGIGKSYAIQKFAHFVYDQNKKHITHVDGAVRVFTVDGYAESLEAVVKGKEPGKRVGNRHKLFKVTGNLDLELVQSLLYEFFRYNPHLGEYFAAPEEIRAYAQT